MQGNKIVRRQKGKRVKAVGRGLGNVRPVAFVKRMRKAEHYSRAAAQFLVLANQDALEGKDLALTGPLGVCARVSSRMLVRGSPLRAMESSLIRRFATRLGITEPAVLR